MVVVDGGIHEAIITYGEGHWQADEQIQVKGGRRRRFRGEAAPSGFGAR
jgi:hypothetical protein